ncbi:Cystinosin like protein, partial [Gryllus bimaculatus]
PSYYVLIFAGLVAADPRLEASPSDIRIEVGDSTTFRITARDLTEATKVDLYVDIENLIRIDNNINFIISNEETVEIRVTGEDVGHVIISANSSDPSVRVEDAFVRITIQHSKAVYITSIVVGWVYFAAWSVSFYPQIYENWKRKSVVGLNFDFLALNIVGFILYSLFNCGLYWITKIEDEYFERYPGGHNPVQINDIVFSLHACFATVITILQCIFYERENQSVSLVAKIILGVFFVFLEISYLLAGINVILWLDFLYYCSYVKLSITLIKYIPQAIMNYRRKSTVGWSIGNILLDFTGGILSMLQMILNAYNYNDWKSIFGDPTKFGLGLFSVIFDIFFMIQHYVLYRGARSNGTASGSGSSDAIVEEAGNS